MELVNFKKINHTSRAKATNYDQGIVDEKIMNEPMSLLKHLTLFLGI